MKRQRIEIMAQILAFCTQRKRKSHIMYGTELSHAQLKTYLKLLMSQDLIATDSNKYVTTYKGHRFIDAFALLNAFLEDDGHSAFSHITGKPSRDPEITPTVDSQDENRAPSNPPKKAAIVILISLSHEAEKKTSEELKTKIHDALQEGLARIPWIALEDVIVVEEK